MGLRVQYSLEQMRGELSTISFVMQLCADDVKLVWLTWCCNCTKSCNLGVMATQWLGLGLG